MAEQRATCTKHVMTDFNASFLLFPSSLLLLAAVNAVVVTVAVAATVAVTADAVAATGAVTVAVAAICTSSFIASSGAVRGCLLRFVLQIKQEQEQSILTCIRKPAAKASGQQSKGTTTKCNNKNKCNKNKNKNKCNNKTRRARRTRST